MITVQTMPEGRISPTRVKIAEAYLVVADGRILGGGYYAGDDGGSHVVEDCWRLSDVQGSWEALLNSDHVEIVGCPAVAVHCVEKTFEKVQEQATQALMREEAKLLGAVKAYQTQCDSLTLRLMQASARVGAPQPPKGAT